MAKNYTIQQGDHLSGIAEDHGFADFDTIWDHPKNSAVRNKRKLPHVLFPGDQLFIPDKAEKIESCPTEKVHRFRLRQPKLKIRIALKDFDLEPIADADCELEIEGALFNLKSNSDGVIEAMILPTAKSGSLRIPALDLEYEVKVGHLDPVEEETGWQARLINLGYNPGALSEMEGEQLRYALEEFQCDHKLAVTGELDAPTRAALHKVHGV